VASVASPLQRRVRPTSRPRGRCDVEPWGEAWRSGTEDGCCDGGPESGLGPEERRGVSGAQVACCDQNEYLVAISRGKGAGPANGLFGFDRNTPLASLARCRPSLGRAVGEAQHESPGITAVRDHERQKPLSDDVVPELLDSRPNDMEFSGWAPARRNQRVGRDTMPERIPVTRGAQSAATTG